MPHYELFHPDTEIIGQALVDFEAALDDPQLHRIFEDYELANLDPGTWYPAQPWVEALNAIATAEGAMLNFVSLGIQQIEQARMPQEFDDMPLTEIFQALEDAYEMNYRGTDVGGIRVEVVDDQQVRVAVRSFEPDDLWYGNLYGLARRYGPAHANFFVEYEPGTPRREEGGEATVYVVTWE